MTKRESFLVFMVAVVSATMYLLVPACGNNSSNNAASPLPPGVICVPGQPCTNLAAQGVPLLNGSAAASLDSQGSTIVLNFAAPGYVAGQMYNGTVNIVGTVNLTNCMGMAGGNFSVQGQGSWQAGVAGSVALIGGSLTINGPGGQVLIANNTIIGAGADQLNPGNPAPYWIHGQFAIPGCSSVPYTAL